MIPAKNPSTTALAADRETLPPPPDPGSRTPPPTEHAADAHGGDASDDFDLRDLADGPFLDDDIFGGLGIAGLDAPARDALDDLFDGVPARKATVRPAPAPSADGAAQPPSGILAELREEFDRVARDPSQLGGRALRQGAQAAGGEQAPTLAQLQRKAQAYRLPHHMMLPNLSIDALIEAIGPADGDTLLDPEERIDVLRLFATDVPRDAPRSLPSLTRVEHHAMALDSHIRTGGVRTPPKESP